MKLLQAPVINLGCNFISVNSYSTLSQQIVISAEATRPLHHPHSPGITPGQELGGVGGASLGASSCDS